MKISAKRLLLWILVIIGILIIPLLAMQFTDEVKWGPFDFMIAGTVLLVLGISYELIARRSKTTIYRLAFGTGLLGAFLLTWVNAAVGIIGNEGQDANLLYTAVLIVGAVGSLIVRFKPKGMSIVLFVAGIIQLLVPVVALIVWPPPTISWSPSVLGVFFLSAFFSYIFIISAMLFKQATSAESIA